MDRFVCIHGHFYQPPRENPWLEAIERAGVGRPVPRLERAHHGRVLRAERRARILDGEDRIVEIVNNYASHQLQLRPDAAVLAGGERPDVYAAILEADRESAEPLRGHGSAIAQAYNHMILPLANAARQGDAGRLGRPRLRAPLRPPAGGNVAARDRRRHGLARGAGGRRASASRSSRRTRPARCGPPAATGRTSAAEGIDPTRPYRVPAAVRAEPSTSSSTTGRSRAPSPSSSAARRRRHLAERLIGARATMRAAGRSSSTSPPTARPTATITASATWRWPTRCGTIDGVAARPAHELRRVPRPHPPE